MTKSEQFFNRFMAEFIFWFHTACGFVLVFFWESKTLYPYYAIVLLVALINNTFSDFCFLAKWEYYFRRKLDPNLDFQGYFHYNFKRFFGLKLSPKTIRRYILVILWVLFSLNVCYWIYAYART